MSDDSGRNLDCASYLNPRANILTTDVFNCCFIFLIKVVNDCDHSIFPAAFRYKIYLIRVSTAGKIVHINVAVLSSSIYYHLNHIKKKNMHRPITYSIVGI